MTKLKFHLALSIIMLSACNAQVTPATSLPAVAGDATPSAAAPSVPAIPPSATLAPTLIPPPAIAPESFAQAKVLHEYWPVVRKAAGLGETASFGTSATAWALSADGRYLAVAGCDAVAGELTLVHTTDTICEATSLGMVAHAFLFILDAKTESILATLPETGKELTVMQVDFTPDGNKLVYGLDTDQIKIWDIRSAAVESVIGAQSPVSPYFGLNDQSVMFSPKAANGLRNETDLWDIAGKKMVGELPSSQTGRVSLDGQKRFIYEYPVFFVVYDTKTGQRLSDQPMAPDGYFNLYDISPDLSLLATCNRQLGENPVKIWNISTGELVKTLQGEWGRCGRLIFSPDGRLLLRFDEHGAGPVIWEVPGWKVVQANANATYFVKSKDLFVDRLQFSQDDRTVLVDTFKRLTLYGLPPPGNLGTPEAAVSVASPTAVTTAAPAPARPVLSCDITVQGALKLHVQPCLPPSSVSAGGYDGQSVSISITDSNYTGVFFEIPLSLVHKLSAGKYLVGDAIADAGGFKIVATFNYYDPQTRSGSTYDSYEPGTFILTQAGQYISGSFAFGARDDLGRTINVEGSFENIPFDQVDIP